MFPKNAHSLGGKKTAIISRERALSNYYKNPAYCKNCNEIIEPNNKKVSEIRKKVFCNSNCSATYNNSRRIRNKKPKKQKESIDKKPKYFNFLERTKEELFLKCKWQSARTMIRVHASFVYHKEIGDKFCKNCGYDKHYEICHIKAVSKFEGNHKMKEINDKNNLIALCPNCHWEFDNTNLKISVC